MDPYYHNPYQYGYHDEENARIADQQSFGYGYEGNRFFGARLQEGFLEDY
ncbi:hypothetical protein MUO14_19810 [Halobacillus shinanisalinarum]|uniref:Uncharacterized protein n=1 Tax=Halobacillus shinanisalinarum TaxID=2932258 RepID=A0ABY4GX04_9BACI|nr:hypothetical protein [Halobacillus shinanisalinarum]UOQ92648.1 hypothetical protein MUO14_19810 [Halobacillus shinanisalinarum]